MFKKIIKTALIILIIAVAAILAGIWASQKTDGPGAGAAVDMEFEYNDYVDGVCTGDLPCRFEKRSCGLEIRYEGTLTNGTIELALYDENDDLLWSTVLTEAGNYNETVSLDEIGYQYSLVYSFPEGGRGKFELHMTERIYNYQKLVSQ